jgi:hypothetical protein
LPKDASYLESLQGLGTDPELSLDLHLVLLQIGEITFSEGENHLDMDEVVREKIGFHLYEDGF